jgi:hypothetical protein
MDVLKALRELYLEKTRIDRLIAICESKIKEQDRRLSRSKRGRKSMSADERKIVSERMRKYWASRRTGKPEDEAEDLGPGAEEVTSIRDGHSPGQGQEIPVLDDSALAATNS